MKEFLLRTAIPTATTIVTQKLLMATVFHQLSPYIEDNALALLVLKSIIDTASSFVGQSTKYHLTPTSLKEAEKNNQDTHKLIISRFMRKFIKNSIVNLRILEYSGISDVL